MTNQTNSTFKLYVSVALKPMDDLMELTAQIRDAAARTEDGAGAGLGFRDMDFSFDTREGAEAAGERIRTAFADRHVDWSIEERPATDSDGASDESDDAVETLGTLLANDGVDLSGDDNAVLDQPSDDDGGADEDDDAGFDEDAPAFDLAAGDDGDDATDDEDGDGDEDDDDDQAIEEAEAEAEGEQLEAAAENELGEHPQQ